MPQKQTVEQFGQSIKAKHPEYKDMDDAALGSAVLAKYPQYSDMVDTGTASQDPSGRTPTGEPARGDNRNAVQRYMDNLIAPDPRREEWQTPLRAGVDDFMRHAAANAVPLVSHPLESLKSGISSVSRAMANGQGEPGGVMAELAKPAIEGAVRDYQEHGPVRGTTDLLGSGIGGAATAELTGAGLRQVPKVGGAIRTAAIGDTDAAALRGLRVPPGSPKIQPTLRSVEGARPFLAGAKSLEDLQGRIGPAKSEIWGKYQGTVDALKDKPVRGPDGQTTVGALEAERQQLSALNRGLKKGSPDALQVAQQKGMSQAQLLDRERAVQAALDPHLEEAGIDPKLIRQTFGQVADIGSKVAGKSTIIDPQKPYGLAKLGDLSLTKPLANISTIGSAARDIAAGRYWSASPTDVGIREGFRAGGAKPDFRAPIASAPSFQYPPRQLAANVPANAEFSMGSGPTTLEPSVGQNGTPHIGRPITPPPVQPLALPATTTPGIAQPMIRYATPYQEPFDPHFSPVDLEEYMRGRAQQ